MGRLLYELGRMDEKKRIANERGSSKLGKSSFSWAWELDGTTEERERSVWDIRRCMTPVALIGLSQWYHYGHRSTIIEHPT